MEFEKVVLLALRSAAERNKIARSFGGERNKIARRYRRKGISWLGNVLVTEETSPTFDVTVIRIPILFPSA